MLTYCQISDKYVIYNIRYTCLVSESFMDMNVPNSNYGEISSCHRSFSQNFESFLGDNPVICVTPSGIIIAYENIDEVETFVGKPTAQVSDVFPGAKKGAHSS